jgi:hypothetical protein
VDRKSHFLVVECYDELLNLIEVSWGAVDVINSRQEYVTVPKSGLNILL